jgi:hypothetical protein
LVNRGDFEDVTGPSHGKAPANDEESEDEEEEENSGEDKDSDEE